MLKALAEKHDFWVAVVKSHGEEMYAEDIVQEMYIKLHDKVNESDITMDGKLCISFVYRVLKNMVIDLQRQKKRRPKVSLDVLAEIEIEVDYSNEPYARFLEKLDNEMTRWHWFDRILFTVYMNRKMSMREIADSTKISLMTIFTTIKNCKTKLKDSLGEDWEDWINEDYELL